MRHYMFLLSYLVRDKTVVNVGGTNLGGVVGTGGRRNYQTVCGHERYVAVILTTDQPIPEKFLKGSCTGKNKITSSTQS
jgi:hypothetical protein